MKSYEEVTRDLLKRRDEYEEAQTKRQQNALRVAVPVCSVALAAVMGIGVWKSGVLEKPPLTSENCYDSDFLKENNQTIESDPMAGYSAGQFVSPDDPKTNDKIIINEVDTIGSAAQDILLDWDCFVEMTYDEMLEYYGADIEPDVPEDLTLGGYENGGVRGIFRRDGGTGEVFYDTSEVSYFNEDFTRDVHIEVAKGKLPFTDCGVIDNDGKEKSVLQDVEIMIVKTSTGCHYAELMVRGVGFRINARGLSDEEFVSVVASIIEKNM